MSDTWLTSPTWTLARVAHASVDFVLTSLTTCLNMGLAAALTLQREEQGVEKKSL